MTGVTYIAKDPEAFRRFYEKFKENVLKPAALALPTQDELTARMKIGLSGCLDSLDQIDELHDSWAQFYKIHFTEDSKE